MEEKIKALKREMSIELLQLQQEQKAFKRRVSAVANLVVPGVGFVLYNGSILKGLITFALFATYNLFHFNKILHNTDVSIAILFYIPAVLIWFISTVMVASLDD